MLPYSEGTLFFVPLRTGGFARGVVARCSREGKVIWGYFFGPLLPTTDVAEPVTLNPKDAILCLMFGDLGLINGKWPILGKIANWIRSEWPMPIFVRKDPLGIKPSIRVQYSDTDTCVIVAESPVTDVTGLRPDLMSGYGSVEIKLTKLLSSK
jgi:hypothetical protein